MNQKIVRNESLGNLLMNDSVKHATQFVILLKNLKIFSANLLMTEMPDGPSGPPWSTAAVNFPVFFILRTTACQLLAC